jgi:hypothetical protein
MFFWRPGRVITMATPTGTMNLKKSQVFVEFPVILLNVLKLLNAEDHIFHLKYLVCCPLCCPMDSAARCSHFSCPYPVTYAPGWCLITRACTLRATFEPRAAYNHDGLIGRKAFTDNFSYSQLGIISLIGYDISLY